MFDNELATTLTDPYNLLGSGFVCVADRPGLGVAPVPECWGTLPLPGGYGTVRTPRDGTLVAARRDTAFNRPEV